MCILCFTSSAIQFTLCDLSLRAAPPILHFESNGVAVSPGTATVGENVRNGTVISVDDRATIKPFLSDANNESTTRTDTHELKIVSGDDEHHFHLDKTTGKLTVAHDGTDQLHGLDYEAANNPFTLTIRATDSGTPVQYGEATLQVTVFDKNENPVLFRVYSEHDMDENSIKLDTETLNE